MVGWLGGVVMANRDRSSLRVFCSLFVSPLHRLGSSAHPPPRVAAAANDDDTKGRPGGQAGVAGVAGEEEEEEEAYALSGGE